jgi:PKHD-type hydroxylase
MLLHVPDILTAEEITNARALLARAPWGDGKPGAGKQAAQVKNNEQLSHDCEEARALRTVVLRALDRNPTIFSAALPRRVFPPRFNRYSGAANYYGNHVDGSIRYMPESGQRVRTDISCTLFISDPAEYDGGELIIQDAAGGQRVKLPAGHLVLYPGTSVHQVTPVTRGERLACFFWIESMVRRDDQRTLLFDMDVALTRLREGGDNDSTVALTGTYHNLLRMWADT